MLCDKDKMRARLYALVFCCFWKKTFHDTAFRKPGFFRAAVGSGIETEKVKIKSGGRTSLYACDGVGKLAVDFSVGGINKIKAV